MIPLFHADLLIEENVGTPEEQKKLLEFIKKLSDVHENKSLSNEGCFRFDFEVMTHRITWLSDAIKNITERAINHYVSLDRSYKRELEKTNMGMVYESWVNINKPNSKNILHAHKDHMFACVYYLQGTDTGAITFQNPGNLLVDCSILSPFVRKLGHTPKDGDLILWPAWVPHEVEVNTSDRQRINITSNINVK